MEVYTSGSDSDSGDIHSVDLSYSKLSSEEAEDSILTLYQDEKLYWNIEFLHLNNNQMNLAPISITRFSSLSTLDLSNNNLKKINWEILYACPLTTLIGKCAIFISCYQWRSPIAGEKFCSLIFVENYL